MDASFINEIILIVVAAFIGGFCARSVKLPPIVGYLISGIIFGVVGRSFITSYDSIFALSQVGVSLLLFTLGFEISLDSLRKINKKILYTGILQVVITSLLLLPLLLFFRFNFATSLLFGMLFSFSSTAVVLKLLEEKGLLSNFPGNNVFVLLLIQDLFIIPVIFLIPFIFSSQFVFPQSLINFLIIALKPLLIFVLLYFASRIFLSKFLHILFRYPSQELTILATIFVAAISIGLLTYAGLPESIAAFFAGVLISEEGKNVEPLAALRPFRDILLTIFFVMMGMLVDEQRIVTHLPMLLLITILILVIKFFVTFFILRFFKFLPSANIFITSHIVNIGEFAAVIGQIAFVQKYISQGNYEDLLSIFILSLLAIPLWIRVTKTLYQKYRYTNFVKKFMGESHYFTNANFKEINDHVIICGHGRVGREVRNLLDMGNIPYVVLDFDKSVIDELDKSMKNALYGDPSDIDVLKSAGIKKAKILVAALPDSFTQKILIKNALRLNPNITILCRSHIDKDKYELVNLGVNTIVLPEFEAGLRIGKKTLELLGFKDSETFQMLKKLRQFHFVH